jgi:FtsP/CotA-like multicopper oxidase with cupredoxin domain
MKNLYSSVVSLMIAGATMGQNPLAIPDTLAGSDIYMTLQTGEVQFLPGQVTQTFGANGNILGPTIILQRFQEVTMHVENLLGTPTTLHWHGMHVPPEADGGPHIVIQEGETWTPSFTVLDWASTYWYHPHLHMYTNDQVQRGISGLIIVRDEQEAALTLPRKYGVDDFPIVVQTKAFDAENQIIIESALDSYVLVNGTMDAFLDVPAQMVRFRLLNGASERYMNFGFSGNLSFQMIGSDGGLLAAPLSLTRLMLAPGERAEIVVDFSALEGQSVNLMSFSSELPNAIYGAAQPGMGAGQQIPDYNLNPLNGNNYQILAINIGEPTTDPVTAISQTLVSHNPWTEAEADITRQLTFMSMNMGPTAIQGPFMINGEMFDMDVINYEIPLDNVEIWQLTNQSPIGHPFHIHDVQFYVLSINGNPPPPHLQGRKDVIHVPAGNSTVRFITKFETYANDTLPYMYHCHILTHEDHGMMGQFLVKNPCQISLTEQPQNQQLTPGLNAVFSVNLYNPEEYTFQWQSDQGFGWQNLSNAGQYTGVTTAELTVSNVSTANHNQLFRCLVTEGGCTTPSEPAVLSIISRVEELSEEVSVSVFPNPFNGGFWVKTEAHGDIRAYRLTDATGKEVVIGRLSGTGLTRIQASVSAGVYVLMLEGGERIILTAE